MEDLYSDLENYQYENIASELRNENQELKCKLEEYATTLASLQKDFDKLSAEYKKLELNYSSLLKTARAEVERKSQLITNLNIEKDRLLINSIQNRGRFQNRKIYTRENNQLTGKQFAKSNSGKQEHYAVPTATDDASVTSNHERKEKHHKRISPLKDDLDVNEKQWKSKKSDHYTDIERNKNEIKKTKVNHSDDFNNVAVTSTVSKIRDRRKSMPLMNIGDFKCSSDEDLDDTHKNHRFRRKTLLKDDRTVIDRVHNDKYRNGRNETERKVSELTRVGDKYASNYDSSRDVYRKTNSWYRENYRHKSRDNRDRYESSQRFRRHYSPERPYNIQGEYYNKRRDSNDRPHRTDHGRDRTLVSPLREKYHQHRRSREFDGQRFQQEAVFPMKHKMHDVIEEPAGKRFRSESLNKQSDKYTSLNDRDIEGHANSMSRPLELSYLSLQSPDYVYLENNPNPVHQIKEIKCTSDTKLDDPRLISKKYIVNTLRDKVVLSTVVGRDVDIKTIDTSAWDKDKAKHIPEMPTPLKERPSINEDLVYMDIDNPMSNVSLESGEICLEEEMGDANENKVKITVNSEGSNYININDNIQNYHQTEVNKTQVTDMNQSNQQTCSTILSKNYKIPKIKKTNMENDNTNSTSNKLNKKDSNIQSHKKKNNKEKKDGKLQQEANDCNSLKMFSDICDSKRNKSINKKHRKHSPEKPIISARDTVEGDLELSDETCDYLEVSDEPRYDNEKNVPENVGECSKNIVIESINNNLNIGEPEKSDPITKRCVVIEHEIETCENKQFNISHEGNKVLPKESFKTFTEQKPKDIKSKLCDLFGDTSSLITLDDLGVVAAPSTKENLNEYAPSFDNTQDAVDLNLEEMEKVQTRSLKLKRNENEPEPVNAEPVDNAVVKTVIISTGIQNNCNSVDTVHKREQAKQPTNIERDTNDNATSCPALLSIKALATSTPYKPQTEPSLSVPEISCTSNNTGTTKDVSNVSSNTESFCKKSQSNLDIPDVRIVVKRRRKTKGAP